MVKRVLLGGEGSVERDGFAVWIGKDELLRSGGEPGGGEKQGVHVLEGDGSGFAAHGGLSAAQEAASSQGHAASPSRRAESGSGCADTEWNSCQLENREPAGGQSKQALAIFIPGEKAAVQSVHIGVQHRERFRQINAQPELPIMRVADVDATADSGGRRRGGRRAIERPGRWENVRLSTATITTEQ